MVWDGQWTLLEFFNKTIEGAMYPDLRRMIDSQLALVKYLRSGPKSLLIRGFKQFRSRGYIYQMDKSEVAISDNEACCGFYQELYNQPWHATDLLTWFKDRRLGISGGRDDIPPESGLQSIHAADRGFVIMRNTGNPFRSKYNLKLSHYLPAADKLSSSEPLVIRAARLLSPFNICLTPKTKRSGSSGYTHNILNGRQVPLFRNDIGETDYYVSILHTLLMERIFAFDGGSTAYQEYLKACDGPYMLTQMHFERCRAAAEDISVSFSSQILGLTTSSFLSKMQRRIDTTSQTKVEASQNIFRIGHTYTIDDICRSLGGSPMPAINTSGGQPTWAKFNCGRGYNPEGPGILGIHSGPVREQSAMAWINTGVKIPFFFAGAKRETSNILVLQRRISSTMESMHRITQA